MNRRGLTVIESLLSVALLAVCIVVLVSVVAGGLELLRRGQDMTVASEIAREELEMIRSLGFASLPTSLTVFDGRIPDLPVGAFPPDPYPQVASDKEYSVVVEVNPTAPKLTEVKVTVLWDDGAKVYLETLLHP